LGVVTTPAISEGCHDATGGTVGGQIGYRWQAASWVFGLEAQGNWADLSGSNVSLPTFGLITNRSRIDAIGLFTGQIGYAWNNVLFYVKGGAMGVNDRYDGLVAGTNLVLDTASETRWGGAVGVGLDFGVTPNVVIGVDYVHGFMRRGMALFFLYTGENQHDYNYSSQLYDVLPGLREYPLQTLHYVPRSDHTFTHEQMRDELMRALERWLSTQVLAASARSVPVPLATEPPQAMARLAIDVE